MCQFPKWLFRILTVPLLFGASYACAQQSPDNIVTKRFDWATFETLNAEVLAKMPLDDPLLRAAYAKVFNLTGASTDWENAARADILRRGKTAIPLLLSLFDENPDKEFRANLMNRIEILSAADLEPFLNAARVLFQKEGLNLPERTRWAIAGFFERKGTAADMDILRQMNYDPSTGRETGLLLSGNIERMTKRLVREKPNPNEIQTPEGRPLDTKRVWPPAAAPSKSDMPVPGVNSVASPALAAAAGPETSSHPSSRNSFLFGITAVILCSCIWLFLRFRKKSASS